ncbi:MAG: type II toxin-antitoxin system PemK/MazF family toxin [bacterium]
MTHFENGDVVLVPFPFSNLLTTKKRPAVVISSLQYNMLTSDIVIIAITSQQQNVLGIGECSINDSQSAGLLKQSTIKPAIATIEQNLVLKKLGKLTNNDLISLKTSLLSLLNIEKSVFY